MHPSADPMIVAFDLDSRERLITLAESLRGEVETVKVGLEAYTWLGPQVLETLHGDGFRVFADLKFHDIPNTVRGAVKGLVGRGVEMLTVHASGGREMLRAAVEAAGEEAEARGIAPPLVLGVTVLTSLDEGAVKDIGYCGGVKDIVLSLADLALSCGLGGVVASAHEAAMLRERIGPEPVIVTPGIRMRGEAVHDQARTVTPNQAFEAGADYLVLGRAITAAADPRYALRLLREDAGRP
jgi:orotidine-5'-phosphate decarboxylase